MAKNSITIFTFDWWQRERDKHNTGHFSNMYWMRSFVRAWKTKPINAIRFKLGIACWMLACARSAHTYSSFFFLFARNKNKTAIKSIKRGRNRKNSWTTNVSQATTLLIGIKWDVDEWLSDHSMRYFVLGVSMSKACLN